MENQNTNSDANRRKEWMEFLCIADPTDLESVKNNLDASHDIPLDYTYIVKPETGLIMVQAKADGSRTRFNLGETTVSRCILKIKEQYTGASWIIGSDLQHAKNAALFDALLQDPEYNEKLTELLFRKLEKKQNAKNIKLKQDIEKTKVEFFTLKRGE